ncbi:MAG: P-loop NTPase family protein [Coleofasciculaceae cyanobacterium SM2_1_6]|nr:P-loop NTPase family protein [Coleofasciculaceae cyanobacterium SM2_1_6]
MIVQLETPSIDTTQQSTQTPIVGMVQVFTNSSSAPDPQPERKFFTNVLAQALRIAQQGTKVLVVQFLKGGINQGSQHPTRLGQNLDWLRCNLQRDITGNIFDLGESELRKSNSEESELGDKSTEITPAEQSAVAELWQHTQGLVDRGDYALIILDELSLAMNLGLIPENLVLEFLNQRPPAIDIIFTGAAMPQEILNIADQVTKIRRSHYF